MDIILILLILILFVLTFLAVKSWKKKNFVEVVYVEKGVGIICYIIASAFTAFFIIFFGVQGNTDNTWFVWLIILFVDIIMLLMFSLETTKCIYLEEDILYCKNIFRTKRIVLSDKVSVVKKIDRTIIKSNYCTISINVRHLSGDIRNLVYKIEKIIYE